MRAVKIRVPEGRSEEVHRLLEEMGYKSKLIMSDAAFAFGNNDGRISWGARSVESVFNSFRGVEIFLPGFGPEYDDLSIEDYFEKRIREMAKNPKNGLNIWHLHFILDRLDKERNK